MQFRNANYNAIGSIDMEINHPEHGWIPFTADPNDIEDHGRELYEAALDEGVVAAYVPPTAEEARMLLPTLSRKQFRLGMRELGVTSVMIEEVLASIPDENQRETAQIEWEDSDRFSRAHPLIAQLATVFGKTEEEIDAEWARASVVRVDGTV